MEREPISIVWFKRDLRLSDHLPLRWAVDAGLPVLLLYCFEPSLMAAPDSDIRHWRFAWECLQAMQRQLAPLGLRVEIFHEECQQLFARLSEHYRIVNLYSHAETGNRISFDRDIAVRRFFKSRGIQWQEAQSNGVIRGLTHRSDWNRRWLATMQAEVVVTDLATLQPLRLPEHLQPNVPLPAALTKTDKHFQPGGEVFALQYLSTFLAERRRYYVRHISKPEQARKSCSRLSPYLAWGALSMRQVVQATQQAKAETGDKFNLNFFTSRLHWQSHFIQKFESECRMEFENVNRGFNHTRTEVNELLVHAWKTGTTGIPMVDACMRCVLHTGYLNFRMRSMLASFFTHHLWQPWQAGAPHLASLFLDYEPGIHYPQFQMQAGTTGINTIRIYNPIKQGQDHDLDGAFIRKWIPELAGVPAPFVHEPWKMSTMDRQFFGLTSTSAYPEPVVSVEAGAAHAREELWKVKNSGQVRQNNPRILQRHTHRTGVAEDKHSPLEIQNLFS